LLLVVAVVDMMDQVAQVLVATFLVALLSLRVFLTQ
jgi:hypothetical protein